MYLIVGLGNPGKKYLLTRHNIGFLAIDAFLQAFDNKTEKEDQAALVTKVKIKDHDVLFAKPQTFMNLSGESVRGLMAFYKIPIENVLVIHDDIDQPFGSIKFQKARGHGGHNGIKNIHELLGTDNYARLKIGVGRPSNPKQDVVDYVLQSFSNEERQHMEDYLLRMCEAIDSFILDGFEKAMNDHNKKVDYIQKTGEA